MNLNMKEYLIVKYFQIKKDFAVFLSIALNGLKTFIKSWLVSSMVSTPQLLHFDLQKGLILWMSIKLLSIVLSLKIPD